MAVMSKTARTIAKPLRPRQFKAYTAEQIKSCADKLTTLQIIILDAALSGDDYAKIAASLSLPVGTVKSRLNRARAAMAKILAAKEGA